MDLELFLGRFHPLVVHLPIGFLFLAIIMELFSMKFPKKYNLNQAVKIALLTGILGSSITVITGILLSAEGSYNIDTLNAHKWMGISVLVVSIVALSFKQFISSYSIMNSMVLSMTFIVLISFTGHFGGVLTHGEDYLFQYAPRFVQKIAGIENIEKEDLSSLHQDSINVYAQIIQPVFEKKCTGCHNINKNEGKLILTSYKDLKNGGEDGLILNIQDPYKSTLLTRVTLPHNNKKFMPTKGTPLSFGEIKILAWWISTGADSTTKFSDVKLDNEIIAIIDRDYGLDYTDKPYYEKIRVEPVQVKIVEKLNEAGFDVESLGESNNLISLKFNPSTLTEGVVKQLEIVNEHITWLDLSNCFVSDNMLVEINKMHNLTRLDLHSNPITDEGITQLTRLKHLESLNLYNTNLSDSGLFDITKMEGLKRLYVWQTNVTERGLDQARSENPDLSIIHGFDLN